MFNVEIVDKLLRGKLEPCRQYVASLVKIQMAYINTNHPEFIGVGAAMEASVKNTKISPGSLSPGIEREARTERSATYRQRSRSPQPRGPNISNFDTFSEKSNVEEPAIAISGEDEQKESLLQYFFKKRDQKPTNTSPTSGTNTLRKSPILSNPNDGFSLSNLPSPVPGIVTPFTQEVELSEKEQFEVQLIRKLMISYFEIVRSSLLDMVPKAIMHNLVNAVTTDLHPNLVENLYKPDNLQELFMEDEMIAKERLKVKEILAKYKQASEVLASI
eukprot:NODE_43_length_33755_cov_1.178542.p15 type:complete len:274 gc:universal NODE_43_length_33755_cov_1.178542:1308-487(-)